MRKRTPSRTAPTLVAIGALLTAPGLVASPCDPRLEPAERIERRIERLGERVELTTEQQARIRAILQEEQAAIEQRRADLRQRIDAVLTPEQLARAGEQRQARIERRLDRLADRLQLSDDQITRVRAIIQAQVEGPAGDRDAARAQISALLTDQQRRAFDTPGPGARAHRLGLPSAPEPARASDESAL